MSTFGTALNVLSAILNGMNMISTRRQILVKSEQFGEVIIPVTPSKYQLSSGQKNKVVDITRGGGSGDFRDAQSAHSDLFQLLSPPDPRIPPSLWTTPRALRSWWSTSPR